MTGNKILKIRLNSMKQQMAQRLSKMELPAFFA